MRDFTLKTYHLLLSSLKDNGYLFQTFRDFIKRPAFRSVILRHDVDARKMNSLRTAKLENELGIKGTYYFRIVPGSFDEEVIKQIYEWGHEVGYHYEDVSAMAKRWKAERRKTEGRGKGIFGSGCRAQSSEEIESELIRRAIESFKENLVKLRRIVPVETVCMHGSPLSRWDNRLLWKYYDYRDFGIVGEPYLDTDFDEVLYLTDTGRRWDGGAVSIRDKVKEEAKAQGSELRAQGSGLRAQSKKEQKDEGVRGGGGEGENGRRGDKERSLRNEVTKSSKAGDEVSQSGSGKQGMEQHSFVKRKGDTQHQEHSIPPSPHLPFSPSSSTRLHSSLDIINAAMANSLPAMIMLTVHPQRWDDRPLPWMKELVWQNAKNVIKGVIAGKMKR